MTNYWKPHRLIGQPEFSSDSRSCSQKEKFQLFKTHILNDIIDNGIFKNVLKTVKHTNESKDCKANINQTKSHIFNLHAYIYKCKYYINH